MKNKTTKNFYWSNLNKQPLLCGGNWTDGSLAGERAVANLQLDMQLRYYDCLQKIHVLQGYDCERSFYT